MGASNATSRTWLLTIPRVLNATLPPTTLSTQSSSFDGLGSSREVGYPKVGRDSCDLLGVYVRPYADRRGERATACAVQHLGAFPSLPDSFVSTRP